MTFHLISATIARVFAAVLFSGQRLLLVSHGGVMHAVHRVARGSQAADKVANCCINVIMAVPSSSAPQQQQQQQQQQLENKLGLATAGEAASQLYSTCCGGCKNSNSSSQACSIHLQVNCSSRSTAGAASTCCCCVSNTECTECSSSTSGLVASKAAAAAAAAAAAGWRQQACGGWLSLVLWNDGHELAARGFVDALSFGGGFKEA
jgi:hypothetical protein